MKLRTLAVSGGPSFIAMVHATNLRYRHDRPYVGYGEAELRDFLLATPRIFSEAELLITSMVANANPFARSRL